MLALHSASVRHAVLTRVTAAIEKRLAVQVTARDFALDARRGILELRDVAAGAPGARPMLTAERLHVEVDLQSLRHETVVVRSILVEAPHIDLGAPMPNLLASAPATPAQPGRRVDVLAFEVRGGSVAGGTIPASLGRWVSGWRAEGIGVSGSFRGGNADATVEVGSLEVSKPAQPALHLRVAASAVARENGVVTLRSLNISGDGIELSASGEGKTARQPSFAGSFTAALEPALVAPELGSGGRIEAHGQLAWPEMTGHVAVQASGLAVDAARAWVDAALLDRLGARGTTLDAGADVLLSGPRPTDSTVTADLTWLGRDRVLARAHATAAPATVAPPATPGIAAEVTLLPESPGLREVTLHLPPLADGSLKVDTIESASLRIELPEVRAAFDEARSLWPELVPAADRAWPVVGALDARVDAHGPLAAPTASAAVTWLPEPGSRLTLTANGEPLARRGSATLALDHLRLGLLRPGLAGSVSGKIEGSGSLAAYRVAALLDGDGVGTLDGPRLDRLHIEGSSDGHELRLGALDTTWGERRLWAHGRASLAFPLRDAELSFRVAAPAPGVSTATGSLALRDGTLTADVRDAETAGGSVAAVVDLPLGTLARIPELARALAGIPLARAEGPVRLWLDAPEVDSCSLLPALGMADRAERLRTGVQLDLWVDPAEVTAATGTLLLAGLDAESGGEEVRAEGPLRLRLANRTLVLDPARLQAAGVVLAVHGDAELAARFDPRSDPPSSVVERFAFAASGAIPAPLLTPYLLGGTASGTLDLDLTAEGTPAAPRATFHLTGEDASFYWPTPYATRVERPELDAVWENGVATLRSGQVTLNRGEVDFAGRRAADGRVSAQVLLDNVAYRLDFGLRATLGGELEVTMEPHGRPLVAGRVTVERGVLDRDIDLEGELLPRFLAPVVTPGTESNPLDAIDLDITLDTDEGVRVRNNLADLRASWERISITGTAWNPIIRGTIDVDPGGLVFAYGQTIRLDRAVATFTGDRATDPRLDISTTSSLEDSSIASGSSSSALAELTAASGPGGGALESLAGGVAGYFGGRITSRLGASLGLTVRPILVFGETDPSARLTVARDFSRYAAFAVSLDLRNAQRQTYLLDLHGFRHLPQLTAQLFTDDSGVEGGTLQQELRLGGGRPRHADETLVGKVVIDAPKAISRRALKKVVRYSPGDALPASAPFDVEVDVEAWLRDQGWPDAVVSVTTRESSRKKDRRDLVITIEPGPRVAFRFTGDLPPRAVRPAITAMYRTGAYEAQSLADMKVASIRALRSLGFLSPEVEVTVAAAAPGAKKIDRTVTVSAHGGRRVELEQVRFAGVPDDVAELLARRFAAPLERTELAAGLPGADARVADSLRVLGYPDGRVISRDLSADGKALEVKLDAGERTPVRSLDVRVEGGGAPSLPLPELPLGRGSPARLDLIAQAAVTIEDTYHARGFADVRVRPELTPSAAGADVSFVVQPGEPFTLTGIDLSGLRHTRRGFALRIADLPTPQALDVTAVSLARGRLLASHLFSSVSSRTLRAADGTATVTFSVVEKPPYTVAYGLRWDNDTGASGVVDLVDSNLLGRGLILGVRLESAASARASSDRSARLYFAAHGLAGTKYSLELFAERRRTVANGLITDAAEETVQLSRQLSNAVTGRLYGRLNDTHITEVNPDPFFPLDTRIKHPYLGTQLIVDRRDDPIATTRGLFASLDLSGSGTFLRSDFKYVRGYGQVNTFTGLGALGFGTLTWAQSVRLGLAKAFHQDLLYDVRFYAGGEYSVRGYPREGLGPIEVLGAESRPAGGAALVVINEELRFPLRWGLTGLVFVDAGQVWERMSDIGGSLAKSFGLGLRATTPLGVLRLDGAYPLDRRPGDTAFCIYFGFGNAF